MLLLVVHLPAEAQANDRDVGGVTVTSPNPGELVIAWDAPGNAPDDYRVTWKKSTAKWPSYKKGNTVDGGNAFPTGTSHTVSGLEEGTAYKARVRARYHNSSGKVQKSGPWSDAVETTISATPSQDGEGDSNEGHSTNPPAKPTGMLTAASHDSVLLSWTDPGDDTITGYQVLRGPDADNLAVLADDTGDANTSYADSSVAAETSYAYAVRARNAHGLGPQSDPRTATTLAAPEEDDPPTSARAIAGPEFTLDGKDLDTTGTCNQDNIVQITDACTINIDTTTVIFAVDGTLDSNDRLTVKIGRDKAAVDSVSTVADESDLRGTDQTVTLTFPAGRSLMRLWGDEDGTSGGSEEHFYRVNVLPYWELNGDRLSKSDVCRSATARTAAQITDADCIVTQFGNAATIRFHNVVTAQFNVYVYVNETRVIDEPDDTALAASFTRDLQDGDNAVRVRLASKHSSHFSENYGTDRFHYKVKVSPAATLSALALTDASDNAVALTPAFASGTTSYNAKVANSVSKIKVEPTANDSNATITYLDDSDSTLADADANTAVFDFVLSEGSNVVKVKVTAAGATTTQTYTINVIRETLNNQGATGAPIITGTATLHHTLTAVTTNISDADGLTGPSFSYQWIRVDTDGSESEISGAVSSTYKLTGDDEGKRLKVRVSFDDDNGNPELLTSAATAAVSPSPCTVEGALQFNGSLSAIDVVIGDSDGTTVTLPSWSGPVCRALFYLGYINSDDVDVFRGDGRTSITSVTFNGRIFSVDQETRELTIRTTSDLPRPWNSLIEFWGTLETYMLVPLDNWGATEESQYQGQDIFVRFHNLYVPNLFFSRNGRTVRFSGGVDYSTNLFPGRPFNAGGYEIHRCDTSAGCTSASNWTRVVQTANGQGTDWSLDRTDRVPSATSVYRYRARQHITMRHDGSTYYGPWSEVHLTTE